MSKPTIFPEPMITKKILAWGMYDLANTIYSALFVTFFFPAYVKNYLGGTEFLIGATFSLSMLLVGLSVPIFGAISDLMQRRMPFIIAFTLLNCLAVILVPHAGLFWALALAMVANYFYHAALNIYNALLPQVAKGHGVGEVSGIGVALGYVGTLISLGVAYALVLTAGLDLQQGMTAVFYATSAMFLFFSLFTFFGVQEARTPARYGLPARATCALMKRFSGTLTTHAETIRGYLCLILRRVHTGVKDAALRKPLRSFLLASFCFTNAMNAVIIFLFLFGQTTMGLTVKTFFPVYAIFALGAAAGSFLFSRAIDTKGPRSILTYAAWTWIIVISGLLALSANLIPGSAYATFLTLGTFGGAALGLVWSSNRPLLISLVPRSRLAEYFGFLELTDKFSGVLGPVVFGYLATYYGYGIALASLLVFFGLGLFFLRNVPHTIV